MKDINEAYNKFSVYKCLLAPVIPLPIKCGVKIKYIFWFEKKG